MSYDLILFQRREEVTLEQINAYFTSDKYEQDLEREEACEDGSYCAYDWFTSDIQDDELYNLLSKAFLSMTIPQAKRSKAMKACLAAKEPDFDTLEMTPEEQEVVEEMEMFLEMSAGPGTVMIAFRLGEGLEQSLDFVARLVGSLASQNIALYDPQIGASFDARCLQEFRTGYAEIMEEMAQAFGSLDEMDEEEDGEDEEK